MNVAISHIGRLASAPWLRWALWFGVLALLCAAAVKQAGDLLWRLSVESRMGIYGDAPTYFAVGRGILNGLVPYRDLLEVKPPGMFLLAALSLAMTGDARLAVALQLAVLLAIPVIVMLMVLRETRGRPTAARLPLLLAAFLVGSGFALYEVAHAGGFQTESFGVSGALLYQLIVCWER